MERRITWRILKHEKKQNERELREPMKEKARKSEDMSGEEQSNRIKNNTVRKKKKKKNCK